MIFDMPPPDPVLEAAIEAFNQQAGQLQVAERRMVVHWAPLFCTCPRWYDREVTAPQQGCTVHGGVLVRADGSGWI